MFDREIPHNLEAERATLGALLLDRDAIIAIGSDLAPAHFYRQAHGWVFEAAQALGRQRTPVDIATVAEELRRRGRLDEVGGYGALAELAGSAPTAQHVAYYAQIVRDAAISRELIAVGGKIAAIGYEEEGDIPARLGAAEVALLGVVQQARATGAVSFADAANALVANWQRDDTHVATGIADFDSLFGGLERSTLITLAARTSVGKTSLALQVAANIAKAGGRVVIFSLEMAQAQLAARMVAAESGADLADVTSGQVQHTEHEARVFSVIGALSNQSILIDDTPGQTTQSIRAEALRLKLLHGALDLVVVDYLTLLRPLNERATRQQQIGEMTRGLVLLARELACPVLALAQVNRAVEARADHRPTLADLREAGDIEQDSAMVVFIYREELHDKDTDNKGIAEVIVAKHRNGPLGLVAMHFDARTGRWANLTRWERPF